MKKNMFTAICVGSVLLMFTFISPAITNAEVNVSIQVPLPHFVIPAPPGLVVIPNTSVYYPPDQNVDIFFYHGYWYRPHYGHWYRAHNYNGPWGPIVSNRVPPAVIAVPAGFRHGPMYERVPYGQVKKNWREWERNGHWDRGKHKGWDKHGGKHKGWEKAEHRAEHRGEFKDIRDFHEGKHGGSERGEHRGR